MDKQTYDALVRVTNLAVKAMDSIEDNAAIQHVWGWMDEIAKEPYTGYSDTCGLRNSHDKRFPIGISVGSRVFVCDNLAFIGDHVIKRKHTANAKTALPG